MILKIKIILDCASVFCVKNTRRSVENSVANFKYSVRFFFYSNEEKIEYIKLKRNEKALHGSAEHPAFYVGHAEDLRRGF